MKILKYLLFLILIVIIGSAIYIAVQPNTYQFERSKTINVPTAVVYEKVNDYKEWPSFSPWMEMDPEATLSYGDKTSGDGASYSWKGDELGVGSMKTLSAEPHKKLEQKIEFVEPFESESNITWSFEPTENGTKVTWGMEGKQDFMTKLYTAAMGSIEKNTAPQFERGLHKLDSLLVEDVKKYDITINGITEHSGGFYIYNTASAKIADMASKIAEMMPQVGSYAISNNISMAGAPFILYHKWDEENGTVMFSCCIPTASKMTTTETDILTGQLPAFKALKTTLKGNYDHLTEAWDKTMAYIEEQPLKAAEDGPMIEAYVNDPDSVPNPKNYITEIYIAVEEIPEVTN